MNPHDPHRAARLRWLFEHWRFGVPMLIAMFSLVAMTVPVVLPAPLIPHMTLLSVLVWSLFQPPLMPPWAAFLIGLVTDLALALPLGVNATLFPVLTVVISAIERRLGHTSFALDWPIVAMLILAYELLAWRFIEFRQGPQSFLPFGLQAATTILAYPFVTAACAHVQRRWALR